VEIMDEGRGGGTAAWRASQVDTRQGNGDELSVISVDAVLSTVPLPSPLPASFAVALSASNNCTDIATPTLAFITEHNLLLHRKNCWQFI